MRYQAVMMLFSGAIGLCLSGCSATSPVMRGQSPNTQFTSWGANCGEGGGACDTRSGRRSARRNGGCENGNCQQGGMCPDGQCHSGMYGGGGCPDGSCQSGACQSGACPDGRCGHGRKNCFTMPFHPVHRNFHTYDVPKGLTYPQQNRPPASYQYPYYTTRGPTDFFMK